MNSSPRSPGAATVPSSFTIRISMPPYGLPHDPGLRSWSSGLQHGVIAELGGAVHLEEEPVAELRR